MSVKTFEREIKKLTGEFQNLIENYDFKEYDFFSIRQTLQDYIEKNYPNYNDYFRSDFIMMLIELFAFYGEMMAYRMDINMNEAYLSTAKERKNVIKIADMLGYKFNRIIPAYGIVKIDLSDDNGGSVILKKIKKIENSADIMNKKMSIEFEAYKENIDTFFEYKLDKMFKFIKTDEFMNTLKNVFNKLSDFKYNKDVKIKRVVENEFEYYERSIFIDKFQTNFEPHQNIYINYANDVKTFEIQSLKFDKMIYMNSETTEKSLKYDEDLLYNGEIEVGIEFVLKYDKSHNILDKNVYMYMPLVQGGTFKRTIEDVKNIKNFRTIIYEPNVFQNFTIAKQYDENDNYLRTYKEVKDLSNTFEKYAYEINNTEFEHIELLFGNGKNAEILLPAAKTEFFYRKNMNNSDDVMNITNVELKNILLNIPYYNNNINQVTNTSMSLEVVGNTFSASNGSPAESNEQIKYMARKIRSIQDRFVTIRDYETAGMLHPRVRYSNVILRTYIGRNSSRMSNEFIDVYFDQNKHQIELVKIKKSNVDLKNVYEYYLFVPSAYFTKSSVSGKQDYISFVYEKNEFYIEILDPDVIKPNEWYKYPDKFIKNENKGKIVKLINKKIKDDDVKVFNLDNINSLLSVFKYKIEKVNFKNETNKYIYIEIITQEDFEEKEIMKYVDGAKYEILQTMSNLFEYYNFVDCKISKIVDNKFSFELEYETENIEINGDDLSFIWTHYKSDDIYLNPSKSNIIEIYVTAIKKDLKTDLEIYEPLNSSEINNLIREINKRKMVSDEVQVYNSNIFEIQIALRIFKKKNYSIPNEMLASKVNKIIDKFFDVRNQPLGKHFYLSKLYEWIHNNIKEIENIEVIIDENGKPITPSSTYKILGDKVVFTQIVEKTKKVNNNKVSDRIIEIIE
jgi:hypothetical protein